MKLPLLVVVGPTASGKTELAVELAERLDGEIIGADSVQVYRRFEVGTGKPTAAQRARVPHHLIDVVDPLDPMDAARWAELASACVADVAARGRRPIVCGGSFLFVKSLLYGLAGAPPGDVATRERHRALAASEGRPALHARLAAVDPERARALAPNDLVRVSRALEIFELSGVTQTAWHREHGFRTSPYEARLVGVRRSSEELDARIRARCVAMFEAGWVEEVRQLSSRDLSSARAMGSVGYREIHAALTDPEKSGLVGPGDPADPDLLLEQVVRGTRVFARRQKTWLRDQPVTWLDPREVSHFDPVEYREKPSD